MVRNMQRGGGMEYLKVRERREKRHFDDALVAVVTIVSEFCILLFEIFECCNNLFLIIRKFTRLHICFPCE